MRDKRKRPKASREGESLPRQLSKPRNNDEFQLLKAIARKIHRELSALGKPVEWLAFESETSRATIRRVFDADRNVGIVTLDRIAKALRYKDIVDFFKRF